MRGEGRARCEAIEGGGGCRVAVDCLCAGVEIGRASGRE